ncbi:MAG: hypothetical protein AB8B53_10445 [Flavobacteriales bacterium]
MKYYILILILFVGCINEKNVLTESESILEEIDEAIIDFNPVLSVIRAKKLTPKEFLLLISGEDYPFIPIEINEFPESWVKKCDVVELLRFQEDTTKCPLIPDTYKSDIRDFQSKSTIKEEALRLINSYYIGWYPCSIVYDYETILNEKVVTCNTSSR